MNYIYRNCDIWITKSEVGEGFVYFVDALNGSMECLGCCEPLESKDAAKHAAEQAVNDLMTTTATKRSPL